MTLLSSCSGPKLRSTEEEEKKSEERGRKYMNEKLVLCGRYLMGSYYFLSEMESGVPSRGVERRKQRRRRKKLGEEEEELAEKGKEEEEEE